MPPDAIEFFISRWENSGAAERANYQMFLSETCDLLEVPRPDPTSPDPSKNLYDFDRAITRVNPDGSSVTNYADLYKARHFVCETKQGSSESGGDILSPPSLPTKSGHGKRGTAAFDRALERAFHQGRGYIPSLPVAEGRPPFLLVCDVGQPRTRRRGKARPHPLAAPGLSESNKNQRRSQTAATSRPLRNRNLRPFKIQHLFSPGLTACRIKSRSSASLSAVATRVS